MQDAWFRLLQQSAAWARGSLEARGLLKHVAIVPPTKDGPDKRHWLPATHKMAALT